MRKILIFLLCFCTLFLCFVIPSFADEGVSPRAVPTNLTGVTVSVPVGWSASAGYGSYNIEGTFDYGGDGGNIDTLFIGFSGGGFPLADNVSFWYQGNSDYLNNNTVGFTINITGGSSVYDTSLIQWFVDNDATFTVPQPETSSIAGGVYHFKSFGNLPDIPDASWSDGTGYTYSYSVAGKYVTTSRTILFTGFNVSFDEYVSASHYTVTFSVDSDDGMVNLATYSVSYGQIELESRADLKYLVFDEALIGTYDDIEFIRQFLVSGFPDTDTSATDNPWAYILEMIIEALKVDLFGYFSVWDIFTTICGIFIVTWLLKLLAGG